MLVPRLPPTAKSAMLRRARTVHVRGSKNRQSPMPSPRTRSPRVSDAELLDPEGAEDQSILASTPVLDLATVEKELKILPELEKHMMNLDHVVNNMGEVNNSAIVCDTQIVRHTGKLLRKFRPFYSEAVRYFNSVYELKVNGTLKDGSNIVPIADLKRFAYQFVDKWKAVVGILNVIKENGMSSLAHYITVKARSIDYAILDITTTNRRNSVHEEALLNCGGKLRQLLYNLNNGLQSLLIHTKLSEAKTDLMKTHVNDVKSFVRIYNDAHIHEFPKSGFCSVDLMQFKSSVMASCNDIIKAIQVAFSFSSDIAELFREVEAVQDMLTVTIERLNLPQTIVRTVVKARESSRDRPVPQPVETLEEYVDGQEVSLVVSTRIDEFVENVQVRMGLPFDTPVMTVWQRLDKLQENLYERIDGMKAAEQEVEVLKRQVDEQAQEIQELLKHLAEEKLKDAEVERSLAEQIAALQGQYEASEQERQKAEETITKKRQRIQDLLSKNTEEQNQEMIHHIGDRMNALMERQTDLDTSVMGNDSQAIQKVDKMNVFVIEKRCSKCRKFEEMRKRIKESLKDIVDFEHGETVEEAILQFRDQVLLAREQEEMARGLFKEVETQSPLPEMVDVATNTEEKSVDEEESHKEEESAVADVTKEQPEIISEGEEPEIISEDEEQMESSSSSSSKESMSKKSSSSSKKSSSSSTTSSTRSLSSYSGELSEELGNKDQRMLSDDSVKLRIAPTPKKTTEIRQMRKTRSIPKQQEQPVKKQEEESKKHDEELRKQQEELRKQEEEMRRKHKEELRAERERLLKQQFDILQEISNNMLQDCCEAGTKTCADVKALILKKLNILRNNLNEANAQLDFQRDLLDKVQKWLNKMTNYTTDGMPIDKALMLMMEAMEMRPTQFANQVSKLQAEATRAEGEIERCIMKVKNMLDIDPSTSPRGVKTIIQNVAILSRGLDKIGQTVSEWKVKVRNLENDLSEARDGLINATEKLQSSLELPEVDLRSLNISSLVLQANLCIEELIGAAGARHFIGVTDINNKTKEMRKYLRMKASNTPSVYLPILSKRVISIVSTLRYAELFTAPLSEMFESLDFKMEPVDPRNVPFEVIREQLFRMHGLISKIPDYYLDRPALSVIRKLIMVSSTLITCIAALEK